MFFSKLFSRDFKACREKGDNLFKSERYAEARVYYQDALNKIDTAVDRSAEHAYLVDRLSVIGNRLAEMNIAEAETAIRQNNLVKAHEHILLSLELADDVTVREKAEKLLAVNSEDDAAPLSEPLKSNTHSCASCSSHGTAESDSTGTPADSLDREQQFHLLINTLPYPLPERYEAMGRKFASAYLLAHEEQLAAARSLFKELLSDGENDIILYELALLEYHAGHRDECEKYLDRALSLNESNPLCQLTRAQLYAESRSYPEAVATLNFMIAQKLLPEQATVMLGDVYAAAGNTDDALEIFSRGLQIPALKKIAAERLVTILGSLNRREEAAFIAKSYLNGCC